MGAHDRFDRAVRWCAPYIAIFVSVLLLFNLKARKGYGAVMMTAQTVAIKRNANGVAFGTVS